MARRKREDDLAPNVKTWVFWACDNLHKDELNPADAPHPTAWKLRELARDDFAKFSSLYLSRILQHEKNEQAKTQNVAKPEDRRRQQKYRRMLDVFAKGFEKSDAKAAKKMARR